MQVDKLELLSDGQIQIRYIDKVYDIDGKELVGQGTYHREVKDTEDDVSALPADVQAVCTAHWTPERKKARKIIRLTATLEEATERIATLQSRISDLEAQDPIDEPKVDELQSRLDTATAHKTQVEDKLTELNA